MPLSTLPSKPFAPALIDLLGRVVTSILMVCGPIVAHAAGLTVTTIAVDATDAPRRILHVRLFIPAPPGALTLVYPRYGIQTYRAPDAILNDLVGMRFTAQGRALNWTRDIADPFAFHLTIPPGAEGVVADLDVVPAPQRTDFNAATGQIFILDWPTIVLYPKGAMAVGLPVEARLRLPVGWHAASSLDSRVLPDGTIAYAPTSLALLADSPVLAGKYLASLVVRQTPPAVVADIAADAPEAAILPDVWLLRLKRIVAEADALFGGFPYKRFHFQIALSDQVGNDGVEHGQSSDIRMALAGLSGEDNRRAYGYLLPHEFVHAWNGKYRIPKGIVMPDFQSRQTTELLWVYEGLTRYLNWVLAARAGVLSFDESLDYAAFLAARMANRPGRAWRSLEDTAVSTALLIDASDAWESLRRGVDYYDEGMLLWLEADATIRRITQGRRSLDDFCRAFFAPPRSRPAIAPYDFDEVVATLQRVAPYDWHAFFRSRLEATGAEQTPLDGLAASGWTLHYNSQRNSIQVAREVVNDIVDERFSIGVIATKDGVVAEVVHNSLAWSAGLGPLMTIVEIDGRPWSAEAMHAAIATDGTGTIKLTVKNGAEQEAVTLKDVPGRSYPHLERGTGNDFVSAILMSRAGIDPRPGSQLTSH